MSCSRQLALATGMTQTWCGRVVGALTLARDWGGLQGSPSRCGVKEECQEQEPEPCCCKEAKRILSLAKLWEKPVGAMNPLLLEHTCSVIQVFLSFPAQPERGQW